MHRLHQRMSAIPLGHQLGSSQSPCYTRHDREAMEGEGGFLSWFICVPVDKCAQNVAFTCHKHGAEVVLGDIRRGDVTSRTFVPDARPPALIQAHSQAYVEHFGCVLGDGVPGYTFMAKMHKTPIGNRFLSLSFHNFMRPCALLCTQLMRALFPDMVPLWEGLGFPRGGFHCWVLQNSAEYMQTIDDYNYNASLTVLGHEVPPFLWQFDF